MTEEIHCHYCGRLLEEPDFNDDSKEGDDMWFFSLNDGSGREGVCCESCFNKR